MLDKYVVPVLKKPLQQCAKLVAATGVTASQVTVLGFVFGLCAIVAIGFEAYGWGLLFLCLNRLADGIDGELARLSAPTDAGAYLDITLDFVFYAMFPLGFAIANPADNALPAAILITSFVGTGASFLAFSDLAHQSGMAHPEFAYKGLYYLDGLAEGTETVVCFALMCLFPSHFVLISLIFAAVCVLTAINRIVFGYISLKR